MFRNWEEIFNFTKNFKKYNTRNNGRQIRIKMIKNL